MIFCRKISFYIDNLFFSKVYSWCVHVLELGYTLNLQMFPSKFVTNENKQKTNDCMTRSKMAPKIFKG